MQLFSPDTKTVALRWIGITAVAAGAIWAFAVLPGFSSLLRTALAQSNIHRGTDGGASAPGEGVRPAQMTAGTWQESGRLKGWMLLPGESGAALFRVPGEGPRLFLVDLSYLHAASALVRVRDSANAVPPQMALFGHVICFIEGEGDILFAARNEHPYPALALPIPVVVRRGPLDRLPSPFVFFPPLALCIGGALLAAAGRGKGSWQVWAGYSAIAAVACMGFVQRWELFELVRYLWPHPDAGAYIQYAERLQWFTRAAGFYSGNFVEREPLFVALANLWFRLFGVGSPAIILLSVAASVAWIVAAGAFAWRAGRHWAFGAVVALVMATNGALIVESAQGLRTELEGVLFLCAAAAWIWGRGWRGAVILGVALGALALLRAQELAAFLPLLWGMWGWNVLRARRRQKSSVPAQWRLREIAVATAIAIALFLPHLFGQQRTHGSASFASSHMARFNASQEFPDRLGTPGFPAREELQADVYAGPPITMSEYLFGLHSIPTLVRGQLVGWGECIAHLGALPLPVAAIRHGIDAAWNGGGALMRAGTAALLLLLLAGMVDLVLRPELRWLALLALWGPWYAAFLYSVRLAEPLRQTSQVYPLILFCQLWALVRLGAWMHSRCVPSSPSK